MMTLADVRAVTHHGMTVHRAGRHRDSDRAVTGVTPVTETYLEKIISVTLSIGFDSSTKKRKCYSDF
jgi:hypothetical protein